MKTSAAETTKPARRSNAIVGALLLGLPVGAAFIACLNTGLIHHEVISRYLTHAVQQVTFLLFTCALGTLGIKLLQLRNEKRAFAQLSLPAWDGKPLPVSEAAKLLTGLHGLPRFLHGTWLGRRVEGLLDFVHKRGSADGMDDQMRALADTDSIGLEGSYGLTRFITWAMPILGFLGTVLGITQAISGVTPESLETNLGQVTGGLGEAFDSTALALGLTMVTMFFTYLVERSEQSVLERVDLFTEEQLAHRFLRVPADSQPMVAAIQHSSQQLLQMTEQLVKQQARIWAETLGEVEKRGAALAAQQQNRLAVALDSALERTLQAHAGRLEQMHSVMAQSAQPLQAQAEALAQVLEQGKHLIQLQALLQQNLSALAGAGAFEQAVQSLTAAIHLLTARSVGTPAPRVSAEPPAVALKLARPGSGHDTGKAA